MQSLVLSENRLTGTVELKRLPPRLQNLDLSLNQLSGSIDLTQLPSCMTTLNLSHNDFTGGIDVKHLRNISNGFTLMILPCYGLTDFSCVSSSLILLDVSNTNLSGDVYLSSTNYFAVKIEKSNVQKESLM